MTTKRVSDTIITTFEDDIKEAGAEDMIQAKAAVAQMKITDIHTRVLGCHCECMGMNAENTFAICEGKKPPYSDNHYNDTMQKWGLINSEGIPII